MKGAQQVDIQARSEHRLHGNDNDAGAKPY